MTERPSPEGKPGHEVRFRPLNELPIYYQQLARASVDFDLVGDFYRLVEEGYDFGTAYVSMCHYIKQGGGFETHQEVREMLALKYDIHFDQEDFIDEG